MGNIIVAFQKPEDARNIRNILVKKGFDIHAVCMSGAQALALMEDLGNGIVVCGYRLSDMIYQELAENLPSNFSMLLVTSPNHRPGPGMEHIVSLPLPLKVHELVEAMEAIQEAQARLRRRRRLQPRGRSEEEIRLLQDAKELLMQQKGMTEEEAHRYIQKTSMGNGTGLIETAQMILKLNGSE